MTDAYIKDLSKAIHYLQNELENEITGGNSGPRIQEGVSDSEYWESYRSS